MKKNLTCRIILSTSLFVLFSALPGRAESMEDLEAITAQAKSLNDFLARPSLVKQYGKALQAYYHKDRFRCDSYERVIEQLRIINKSLPEFGTHLWEPLHLKPVAVRWYENDINTESETEAAPIAKNYIFKPVPRRFHGIWNDPSQQGCLKDGCARGESATPERWAIGLKQTELYNVEKDGIFLDLSLLVVPVLKQGSLYPMITLGGGPQLLRPILVKGKNNHFENTTLLHEWIKSATARMPDDWKAFVMVRAGHAWENFQIQVQSADNTPGKKKLMGVPAEYSPQDPLALKLEKTLPRRCLLDPQGTLAANFLGLPRINPKNLAVLADNPKTAIDVTDPQALRANLKDLSYGNLAALDSIPSTQTRTAESTLTQMFLKDPDVAARRQAGLALNGLMKRDVSDPSRPNLIRGPASEDPVVPSFNRALSDPDPGVRALAGLNLLENGVHTPAAITPVLQSLQPALNVANQDGSWQPNQDPAFVQSATDQVLQPQSNVDSSTADNMISAFTQLPDSEERKRAAYLLADYLRTAPDPDAVARALFRDPDKYDSNLKEFRDAFAERLRSTPPTCKQANQSQNGNKYE